MAQELGDALATAARAIHTTASLDETLQLIVDTAKDTLPGFDAVGISTVDKQGNVHTRAATGDLVLELDRIQYSNGQGPCVDSLHEARVVSAPRIREDTRWPLYVPAAVEQGLKSQLAVKLYLDEEGTLGGLNIYSTTSEDIDPDAETIARLFAAHAAIALGNAKEAEGLRDALRSRTTMGAAIGLIMQEYTLSQDAAFGLLVRSSSRTNIKMREIAQRMVNEAEERATR